MKIRILSPETASALKSPTMVGVPGKYKGCETCRRRRVKCDNERPLCKKCVDSGRPCEGYQRDLVFITATVEDGGRCSSHPRRQIQGSSRKVKTEPEDDETLQLVAAEPLAPAWHDQIRLMNHGAEYLVQLAGLHTRLQNVVQEDGSDGSSRFSVTNSQYSTPDFQMPGVEGEFDTRSQCLVHLPSSESTTESSGNLCVFLYEHASSAASTVNLPPWQLDPDVLSVVRRLGSEAFRSFPSHHFFVRVYRPSAISVALLNRRETFLAAPEWATVPWEIHPKTMLDRLFDIVVLLPSIFTRTDRLLPGPATQIRRLRAQDLLANCLHVERQFDDWYSTVIGAQGAMSFWLEEQDMQAQIPFAGNFAFGDGVSAIMFIYYWMALLLFHRCIESLHRAIFQPVIDAYPNMYPDLPPNLMIDEMKYQQGRELAARICRSFDFALNHTAQPDLLAAPLTVVQDYYRDINQASRDGELEILWCEHFRARLLTKGQHLSNIVGGRKWAEVGKF